MKRILVSVLCFSLAFPLTLLADITSPKTSLAANKSALDKGTSAISQALLNDGIKLFDSRGQEVSLAEWAQQVGASDDTSLKGVFPRSQELGFNRPLGIYLDAISIDSEGLTTWLAFTNETHSKVYSSGMMYYDFHKSPQQNNINVAASVQKVLSHIPAEVLSRHSVHRNGLIEKVARLLLPRAEAGEDYENGPLATAIDAGLYAIMGVVMSVWAVQAIRLWRVVPYGAGGAVIIGAFVMGSFGASWLIKVFNPDDKCKVDFTGILSSEGCLHRLTASVWNGIFS